tara:strand:+ start:402 stop:1238 length:837 start_codon:yes stop_codon:yes gene_type:complete
MIQGIINMIGGAGTGTHNNRVRAPADDTGVLILDLQSVITYGTNGERVLRDKSNPKFLNDLFTSLDEISSRPAAPAAAPATAAQKDQMKKVIILSDGLKLTDFINLLRKEGLNTAAGHVQNICEEDNTYHVYTSISNKYSKLVKILQLYTRMLSAVGPADNSILYLSRLYSSNKSAQDDNIKKLVKTRVGNDNNFKVDSVDNPANIPDYKGNMVDRVYNIKSIKELYEMPQYANPFIMSEEHYKSMIRKIDIDYDLDGTKFTDSGAITGELQRLLPSV